MGKSVKVAIIGAGSAGLSAASQVKKKTDDYLIVNAGAYGTTCARVGCMPSKVFIHAANDFHRRKVYEQLGIRGGEGLSVDIPQVMNHVRGLRDRFVRGVMSGVSGDANHNLKGFAKILAPDLIQVDGEKIKVEKIIVAVGSSPVMPRDWKDQFGDKVMTTDEFFEQKDIPERVAVAGVGVIGLELGQAMSRLGVDVIGVNQGHGIAGISDPVIRDYAVQKIGEEFPLWLGEPALLESSPDGILICSGEKRQEVDAVLVSLGRRPSIKGLGLENLGVPLNDHGLPEISATTCQVGELPVFICGDVTGERAILHEASDEGRIAGYNAVHEKVQCFARRAPLTICFSDPNIAVAGKAFSEVEHLDPLIGEVSFEGQGRSLSMVKAKGHLRVYACKKTGKLLGAEMIAPHGEHLAHLLSWSIQAGEDVFQILEKPFYHPVVEEGLRTALRDISTKLASGKSQIEMSVCEGTGIEPLC